MPFGRPGRVAVLAALAISLAIPAIADASREQETIFEDDSVLIGTGVIRQEQMLDELVNLGVDKVRVNVFWRTLIPGHPADRRRPVGNPSSPDWYRPGRWAIYDSLVRLATQRGIDVQMTPTSASSEKSLKYGLPGWARSRDGSPKPREFELFVRALGERYNGHYAARGGILPRVRFWSIWNEPNQPGWLLPQWKKFHGRHIPWAPHLYRDLYLRARAALARTGHRSDTVYIGETASIGRDRASSSRTPITPGLFYRELACVDRRLHPYRGRFAAERGCRNFHKIPASGVAHHFYTRGANQPAAFRGKNPDIFTIGGAARIERLIYRLGERGRLRRNLKIWNTEFGYQTNPPDDHSGLAPAEAAEQANLAEYLQWRRYRIRSWAQYLMVDDPCIGPKCLGYQTGLKNRDGDTKVGYQAFMMPIVVRWTTNPRTVRVWGASRPTGRGAVLQIAAGGVVWKVVRAGNDQGYFDTAVTVRPGLDARFLTWYILEKGTTRISRGAMPVRSVQ